jgi:hypothetical protein
VLLVESEDTIPVLVQLYTRRRQRHGWSGNVVGKGSVTVVNVANSATTPELARNYIQPFYQKRSLVALKSDVINVESMATTPELVTRLYLKKQERGR